jgi:hypothetical protein
VREIPPHLRRRQRGRSRRPGKSDPVDALAIARVTLREPDLPPVRPEVRSTELGLLADARDDLVHAQTRARNRIYAHLVILIARLRPDGRPARQRPPVRADRACPRGNRRLNRALYTIALSQAWHHEPAKAYIARKRVAARAGPRRSAASSIGYLDRSSDCSRRAR